MFSGIHMPHFVYLFVCQSLDVFSFNIMSNAAASTCVHAFCVAIIFIFLVTW